MNTARAAFLSLLALGGCAGEPRPGPPDLRYGRDLCIHCGMVIVDERTAAALELSGPAPDQPPVFDDIGCLVDHLAEKAPAVTAVWVKDYSSRAWIPAASATFVLADGIETAMGSGLAAFASPEAARPSAGLPGAEVLTHEQLAPRRLRWRHERFGTPLK